LTLRNLHISHALEIRVLRRGETPVKPCGGGLDAIDTWDMKVLSQGSDCGELRFYKECARIYLQKYSDYLRNPISAAIDLTKELLIVQNVPSDLP